MKKRLLTFCCCTLSLPVCATPIHSLKPDASLSISSFKNNTSFEQITKHIRDLTQKSFHQYLVFDNQELLQWNQAKALSQDEYHHSHASYTFQQAYH